MPRPSAPDPSRQLMIKAKACQRLEKEVKHYQKEVVDNQTEWQRVQDDPTKDEYDAKRYRDIYEESVRMVPDAERRLEAAINDLSTHVQQHFANDNENDTDNEWLKLARQIIVAAQSTTSSPDNNKNKEDVAATGGVGGEETNVENLAEGEAF